MVDAMKWGGVALACVMVAACSGNGDNGPVPCRGAPFSDDVCIPGGTFTMGHDPLPLLPCPGPICDPPHFDYAPPHRVKLSPFFIDRDPATNAQYLECFQAGMCPDDYFDGDGVPPTTIHDPRFADYPVSSITADGAAAYCQWRGKRLPTEAEWERAARGLHSFDYPWGNAPPDCSDYPCAAPPFAEWDRYYFYPVGVPTGDVSPEGVRGMITSAEEIVADHYDAYFYQHSPTTDPVNTAGAWAVVRGNVTLSGRAEIWQRAAHFNGKLFPAPAWARSKAPYMGGVRCARDDNGARAATGRLLETRRQVLAGKWGR